MSEFFFWSATRIAKAIRRRELSAVDVVAAHLERIASINPTINAVVQLSGERALDEAKEADRRVHNGTLLGPLDGVPFTIKDSLDTAGIISTAGTQGRRHFVPDEDATTVARLRAAGAILLGKTNTPEMTMGGDSDNEIYGRTNNPYDPSLSTGGSSGGSAAAVATGFSALDLGSDTGGSVREPAHYCGIAGHKPSAGLVPRTGHIVPWGMGAVDTLTQIGPLTRFVEDIALVLPVIAGPDWIDPSLIPLEIKPVEDVNLGKLRIASYSENGIVDLHPDMAKTMEQVVSAMRGDGFSIRECLPDALPDAVRAVADLRSADGGAMARRLLERAGTKHAGPLMSLCLRGSGASLPGEAYSELLERVDEVRSRMLGFMRDFDAIVCPVTFGPARAHGESLNDHFDLWSYATIYNLTGWPATCVRAGTSTNGLPLGVQVAARPWRDDVAIALAGRIEKLLGGYRPPAL